MKTFTYTITENKTFGKLSLKLRAFFAEGGCCSHRVGGLSQRGVPGAMQQPYPNFERHCTKHCDEP